MFVVGLTGGVGSGKSTVAQMFNTLGVQIVDADVIAKKILEENTEVQAKVLHKFGDLDRSKIRDIIFKSEEDRQWLERLLHPIIIKEINKQTSNATTPYCVAVVPLLIENRSLLNIDRILVISAPMDVRVKRTTLRDDVSMEDVQNIVKAQIKEEDRLLSADDVIINDEDLNSLEESVLKLHQSYLKIAEKS